MSKQDIGMLLVISIAVLATIYIEITVRNATKNERRLRKLQKRSKKYHKKKERLLRKQELLNMRTVILDELINLNDDDIQFLKDKFL